MGNLQAEIKVIGLLSRHNSPQDRTDDALWADLYDRIVALTTEDKYHPIVLVITGPREP